jgi:hypothetical protein
MIPQGRLPVASVRGMCGLARLVAMSEGMLVPELGKYHHPGKDSTRGPCRGMVTVLWTESRPEEGSGRAS